MASNAASSFRAGAATTPAHRPSRPQLVSLVTAVVVVAAGVSVASLVVKPTTARAFTFFYGSVFLNDNSSPVGIDLASGKPTVRLANPTAPVTARTIADVDVVSLDGGNTLMLNTRTGEFNMVDPSGFDIKTTAGGVKLPRQQRATAIAAGSSAYIVQNAAKRAYVYLVNSATVSSSTTTADRKSAARAYAELNSPLTSTTDLASANGGLWVLTGIGGATSAITELEVPPHSNAGAALVSTSHGTVAGPAAIESATVDRNGTGPDVVGVASASSVQVFTATGDMDVPVHLDGTVQDILAVSNAAGALVFLYRSSTSGWNLVTVPASGAAGASVVPLPAINAGASLIAPAESNARTYVIDSANRTLWQLDASHGARPVWGAATYPKDQQTQFLWASPEIIARGDRVIFNNPASSTAVVVFSDDSRKPRFVNKRGVVVAVDPAGAAALIEAHTHHTNKAETTGNGVKNDKPTPRKPAPLPAKAKAPQSVDNRVDCATVKQTPHIPRITSAERAARSIMFHWIYPTFDPTDCAASTYVLDLSTVTPNAPHVSLHTLVQGQNDFLVGGLYPATTYRATVTAYINGVASPPSAAFEATTGPEGPQAPTGVTATPDSAGNWTVSWESCGGIAQGCVQTTGWTVIPSFCDHLHGLYSNPDELTITADPTEHSFHTVYPGSDALLGRALCFRVQGTAPDGTIGDVSASTPPAYSWRPPVAGALHLVASRPAATGFGAAGSTDLTLDLGPNPVLDVGGVGATVTFLLHGPDGTQRSTEVVSGHDQRITASFPGIHAGQQYTAQARVSPPRHPGVSVLVNGGTVTTRANWPQLGVAAQCVPTDPNVRLACTLSVRITGLSSAAAAGERFTLSGNSYLRCGETYQYLHEDNFDPSVTPVITRVDLLSSLRGLCSVSVQLIEGANQADPPVFGGTTSPIVTQSVDLGRPTTLNATARDFTASFSNTDGASVDVVYTGQFGHDDVTKITRDWHEQIYAPDGTQCGGDSAGQAGQPEVFIDVKPFDCILSQRNQPGWTVTISYFDAASSSQHVIDHLAIPGTPPGYIPPCTVDRSNFDAHWSGTFDNPSVTLDFAQNGADIDGCDSWNYQVTRTPLGGSSGCGRASAPVSQLPIAIPVSGCDIKPGPWSVTISFRSASTGDQTLSIPVGGTAPQPPPTTPPPTTPPTTPPPTTPPPTTPPPTTPPPTTPPPTTPPPTTPPPSTSDTPTPSPNP